MRKQNFLSTTHYYFKLLVLSSKVLVHFTKSPPTSFEKKNNTQTKHFQRSSFLSHVGSSSTSCFEVCLILGLFDTVTSSLNMMKGACLCVCVCVCMSVNSYHMHVCVYIVDPMLGKSAHMRARSINLLFYIIFFFLANI